MEYFHKDLCHLLSRNLSKKTLAKAVEAAKAAAAKAAIEAAEAGAVVAAAASLNLSEEVAMRKDTFPVSLLISSQFIQGRI